MEASYYNSKRNVKPRKSKEKTLNEGDDRISTMPNPVLTQILSLLPSTVEVARTSVLSKKWRFIWISTPILDFDSSRDRSDYNRYGSESNFVSFVNLSLILNRSSKIGKFKVHFAYDEKFVSDVDVWLSYVTRLNVEELDLDFSLLPKKVRYGRCSFNGDGEVDEVVKDMDDECGDSIIRYSFPMNMFSDNSSLVILKLTKCDIAHARLINWKSLVVLCLSHILLYDDFISNMLSGCLSLEVFELHDCWNFQFLDIKSERIRKLVLSECALAPRDNLRVEISAPRLQSLDISGNLDKYSFNDLSSLVEAKLNSNLNLDDVPNLANYRNILVENLKQLQHVKYLTIGSWCLQLLSVLEEKELCCPLSSLVSLNVDTGLGEKEDHGIAKLLAHTPLIETLVVDTTSFDLNYMISNSETEILNFNHLDRENCLSYHRISSMLALQNIKTVRIVGFLATKREVKFLLFMLKNACMLEQMIIIPRNSMVICLDKSVHVTQTLLSFPRSSPKAVVLFA